MSVEFFDRQDLLNPANGARIDSGDDLSRLLSSFLDRKPFFCELLADNGYKQLVGVGGGIGCVQHSARDGNPPYLMAVANGGIKAASEIGFLIGNTATPISMHYCMPFETVKHITTYFLETGKRDPSVSWEEI
jgi:hypothetical protein